MADREAQLADLRRARLAAPDDRLAAEHAAKQDEIRRLDTEAAAGQAHGAAAEDTRTTHAPTPAGAARVTHAVRAVGRLLGRLGHLASLVGPAIRYSGGPRGAVRKAAGLIRREGLSGIRYGVRVADHSREPSPEQLAAVFERALTCTPTWYSADDPQVSLVVVNTDDPVRTIDCLRSVWEHTAGHRYEIVLVDNASRPEDFARLSELEGPCRIVRLPLRRADGEARNLGAEAATGRFLALMAHGIVVTHGWLEPLMDLLSSTPDCGAVGPKILAPGGSISDAGGLLDDSGRIVRRGRFRERDDPAYVVAAVVDCISPACTLLRTEDFERVLGYDLTYGSGYEHADVCLKLSRLGLQVYYAPASVVVCGDSPPAALSGDMSSSEVNRAKFVARWGGYLRTGRHTPPPEVRPVVTCDATAGKPTAAVYTAHPLTPGGGERFLLGLMSQLLRLGYQVHLVTPGPYSRLRVTALAAIFDISVEGLCLTPFDEAVQMAPFEEFVAMGIDLVPPVGPMGGRSTYLCQFPFPTPDEEIRRRSAWYGAYDRVVVYSAFAEAAMVARARAAGLPELPIEIVAPAVPLSSRPISADKSGILSVGRFFMGGHSKRQDLQIKAFRKLVASGGAGDAVLHLVGSSSAERENRTYLHDCIAAAEGLPVQFHIDAGADVLDGLYESCSLFWHSSGLGVDVALEPERCEHFGISPIEAMSYGTIPLVVGNGGPAAIITDGVDGYHYDDVEELVRKTARLLALPEQNRRPMRIAARERSTEYGGESFAARVGQVFSR